MCTSLNYLTPAPDSIADIRSSISIRPTIFFTRTNYVVRPHSAAQQKWLVLLQFRRLKTTDLNLDYKFLLVKKDDADWTSSGLLCRGGICPWRHGPSLRHSVASTPICLVSFNPSSLSQCRTHHHQPAAPNKLVYTVLDFILNQPSSSAFMPVRATEPWTGG